MFPIFARKNSETVAIYFLQQNYLDIRAVRGNSEFPF